MKNPKYLTVLLLMAIISLPDLSGQDARPWFQDAPWRMPVPNSKAKTLPLIKVQGNKFITPDGKTVLFRGMSISDPDKIERQGHWNKAHFEQVKKMGSMIVRIPVHPVAWREWKKINENIIGLIRAFDTETIPLVAGFDWAYDLSPLRDDPVNARGIGYVTHPYSNKRSQPWEPKWEEDFGFAADRYPVVASEFGLFTNPGEPGHEDYGNRIINYLEGRGISWICWVYDPEWGPQLLKSWNYDLTEKGEFFKKAMHGELDVQKD